MVHLHEDACVSAYRHSLRDRHRKGKSDTTRSLAERARRSPEFSKVLGQGAERWQVRCTLSGRAAVSSRYTIEALPSARRRRFSKFRLFSRSEPKIETRKLGTLFIKTERGNECAPYGIAWEMRYRVTPSPKVHHHKDETGEDVRLRSVYRALKELDPVPQFKATAKLGEFWKSGWHQSSEALRPRWQQIGRACHHRAKGGSVSSREAV